MYSKMMANDSREFDIIIFGASGYTGKYVVEELWQTIKSSGLQIKWAVAGRSEGKLKDALILVQEYLGGGMDVIYTPVMEADVHDPLSVLEMCKRTKLLLNCVGPYNLYGGEMIVATCIECKTHCVDISAEIKYLDTVQANYFELARERGVYIVESCGLGSLPTDYAITLLMKKFSGDLNSVEYYVEFIEGPQYPSYLSAGLFSRTGPTREQVLECGTKITFYADGWKNKTTGSSLEKTTDPDTKMKLVITGPEPAYQFTALCMVQAGLTILEEQEKMPLEGGVLTPGVAFADTTLQERLEKRGVTFTFEENV